MAGDKGVRAGRAFVELFADDTKLAQGLRRAEMRVKKFGQSLQSIGKSMMGIGALITGPLLGAAKMFSTMGDSLAKMSKRTGFSVESLSQLGYAAEISGASIENLETGIRRMQRSISDAGRGLSTATDALAALGVSVEELAGLTPEEQFNRIADGLAGIADPTKKAAVAMELFGRAGTMLLPMMAKGAAGIAALKAEADAMGLTISTKDAKAAEVFTDKMAVMWKTLKVGAFTIGAALVPALTDAANWLIKAGRATADWIKAHEAVVATALKVGAALVGIGAAVWVIGGVTTAIGGMIGVLRLASVAAMKLNVALVALAKNPAYALIAVGVAAAYAVEEIIRLSRETDKLRAKAEAPVEDYRALYKAKPGAPKVASEEEVALSKETADKEAELDRRVTQLKLQQIDDEYAREKALIDERYDYETKKAVAASATQNMLNDIRYARDLEHVQALNRQWRRQDEEKKRAAAQQAALDAANQARRETVADLELRVQMEGGDSGVERLRREGAMQMELLAREGERAIAAAKEGVDLPSIAREYILRGKLLGRSISESIAAALDSATGFSISGLFEGRIGGMGAGSAMERTAKATEKQLEVSKETRDGVKQLVFKAGTGFVFE